MSKRGRSIEKSTKITTNCSEICLKAKVFGFNDFANELKSKKYKIYKL
ncbi:hypothetical protein AQPE_2847 [Aquipluma nitroreducens]|uniref:Uncharacterized protein n=1 Tax=Aquipluma nitroreducens TaxID=2010828 RepID=A0A5K7SAS6_9BACT|nr:hypothetical protein AQPE_2847 [Aquipluma nitroreducens]